MKEIFDHKLRLSPTNKVKLDEINKIIEEYMDDGYELTLRQLYYQLVSRDMIPNTKADYKKIGNLLTKGRMAGVVDWSAIEDRLRLPKIDYSVDDIPDAMRDTINQYKLDRMDDQDCYIELWVEKDALSGVLRKITSRFHINLMVNRGYSSCSAMYQAAKRFKYHSNKKCTILYLGDHDPSGLDMIRDIGSRLKQFEVEDLEIKHIGLTQAQIKKFKPPPNPAKVEDPRAKDYIREFGRVSWEVDALDPKTLNTLVKKEVEKRIDMDRFKEVLEQETADKRELEEFVDKF